MPAAAAKRLFGVQGLWATDSGAENGLLLDEVRRQRKDEEEAGKRGPLLL